MLCLWAPASANQRQLTLVLSGSINREAIDLFA
jgi:hypothetical protein